MKFKLFVDKVSKSNNYIKINLINSYWGFGVLGFRGFEAENEPITLAISSGDVGVKKME